jgi:hypothetical protein
MWRKYAKKFFELIKENFFVGLEELGLTKEELEILQNEVVVYNEQKRNSKTGPKRTLGAQLMWNIAREILRDVDAGFAKLCEEYSSYSKERDKFFYKEFEKLPLHERHFLAMWFMRLYRNQALVNWIDEINEMRLIHHCMIIVYMSHGLRSSFPFNSAK